MSGYVTCRQCGGPRHEGSGKRCRICYLANARDRRDGTDHAMVLNELLHGEHRGVFVCYPDGWTLPEFRSAADEAALWQPFHVASLLESRR